MNHNGEDHTNLRDLWPDSNSNPYENASVEDLKRAVNGKDEASGNWPVLNTAALHGVAGDVVRIFAPHSEADPAAILFQTLTACGNIFGRSVYCEVEQTTHYLNLFTLIVGETSKARKGTSLSYVRRLCQSVDPVWAAKRITSGLSSAEGLLAEVEDDDETIKDKRLLVVQGEFASVLRVMERDGNNLSPLLRDAFDGLEILRTMVKRNPQTATDALISIIGHITRLELLRHLSDTEAHNGFANRLLWCCAKRSRILPEGGSVPAGEINALAKRLSVTVKWSKTKGIIKRDDDARALWRAVYETLSAGRVGLLGAATSRAEAYTMRLSALYAVLDQSPVVRVEHLLAALAVWNYCLASACYIFGNATGDPVADRIREALTAAGDDGLSRTEISALFGRNASAERITNALNQLLALGIVEREAVKGNGRPSEVWHITK
ncbi:MAG: hypothetical protein WBX22_01625 [Silvibacterium sp.]